MSKPSTWLVVALLGCLVTCGPASGTHAFRPRQKAAFVAQLRRHLNFAGVLLPAVTCTPPSRHFHNGSCFHEPPGEIILLQKELHVHNIRTTSPAIKLTEDGLMRTNEVTCKKKGAKSSDVILGILPSKTEHTKAFVSKLKCHMLCDRPPPPGFWGGPPPLAYSDEAMLPVEAVGRRSVKEAGASPPRASASERISPRLRAGEGQLGSIPRRRPPPPTCEAVLKLASWLAFLEGGGPGLAALLSGGRVDCDCRLVAAAADGAVTEVYLARPASVVGHARLGRWEDGRLHWRAEGRFQRATDLRGLTLTCLAVHNWPLTTVEEVDGSLKIDGFIPSVWRMVEQYLNFSTKCFPTKANPDDNFENKIFEYGVDVGLTGVIASLETKERSSVTTKLVSSWVGMVVRRRGAQAERWRGFLRPFSQALWAALLAVVVALLLLLWPLHRVRPQPDAHFMLIAAFLQQAPGGVNRRGWFRVLLVAAHLTTAVLVSGYSASLVSSLATGSRRMVEDYWTMAASNMYHLHLVYGAKETSILTSKLHNVHQPPRPPGAPWPMGEVRGFETHMHLSYGRALAEVCRHQHNVALLHWSRLAKLWREAPCPLDVVPASLLHVDLVIPMRKDTPYLGLINYSINKLRQGGIFRRYHRNISLNKTLQFQYDSVAIDNVCAVLYFYMAAIIGSLVILVLEKCTFNNCHHRLLSCYRLNFIFPLR